MRRPRLFAAVLLALIGWLETVAPVLADSHTATPAELPATSVPQGYRAIAGEGWSFSVPPDWQSQIAPPNVGAIAIPARLSDSQGQIFITLAIQPLSGDVAKYTTQILGELSTLGATILDQRSVMAGSLEWVEVESTFPLMTPPERLWQRISATSSTGYVLTCATLETNAEAARTICASIFNTFQISMQ